MKISVQIHRPELLTDTRFSAEFFTYSDAKDFFGRMERIAADTHVPTPNELAPEKPTTKHGFVFFRSEFQTKKGEIVRLITENDNRVDVRIVKATRGKEGKMEYETHETLQVADGSPEEVSKVIATALANASRNSK